jgi:hypothetical protein
MPTILTKPLIVPEYNNGKIKLYTPDPTTGEPVENIAYTIDMQIVLNRLFPGRSARPNCCKLLGIDLFVTLSSDNSQAVIRLPDYLSNPSGAQNNASAFSIFGNDYVGLAFDKSGNLYVAEGSYGNNQIVKYSAANTPTVIGNAGATSYFANLVFDAAGNLWVSDAQNHRVVAFDATGLTSGANSYHVLANLSGSLNVANTSVGLNAPIANLFAAPEGLDFDSFDATANLWVANNNDPNNGLSNPLSNGLTSLVKIPKVLQNAVLATANGGTATLIANDANSKFFIYQVPNSAAGKPKFGGLQVDKAGGRLYVNEQVSGKGRAYDLNTIAATSTNSVDSELKIVSTNPGNGGIALLELSTFLADDNGDQGREPNINTPSPWQSLAISLTQANGGPLITLPPNENIKGGIPCYLYVEVKNFSSTPTVGIETLDLKWAKASAGLGWEKPWDGSVFDQAPFQASKMGGKIQTGVKIPVIPALGRTIVGPIEWVDTPDPSKYSVQDGHFCLLARIVTPGLGADGMSYPEGNNLVANVLNNARIAWRNIHIINPITGKFSDRGGVQIANYTELTMNIRLAIELLNSEGERFQPLSRSVLLSVTGASLDVLRRSSLGDNLNDEEPFVLPNIESGIDNITLAPDETASFTLDYIANPTDSYAVRVIQYAKEINGERLIGGQTFVKGQVNGFPIKPSNPDGQPPVNSDAPKQRWWWLLLVVILILLILYLLLK